MLEYLLSCDEMRRSDRYTMEKLNIPSLELMERAALGVVNEVLSGGYNTQKTVVVCGSGNNGGDGLATAAILKDKGVDVGFVLFSEEKLTEETAYQLERCGNLFVPRLHSIKGATCIIDALFGIGLVRNVEGEYSNIINQINESDASVISIDIPSGINGDTGKVMGSAVKADTTVVISHKKIGMLFYPAKSHIGKAVTVDIGISLKGIEEPKVFTLNHSSISLPKRIAWGHKGSFGKILVIGAAKNMAGACYIAAHSACKTGAGLVRILTDDVNRVILQTLLPEAVLHTYSNEKEMAEEVESSLKWADLIVIGCGLGRGNRQNNLVKLACQSEKPMVIDADALNIIASDKSIRYAKGSIFTPHIGEMATLTGKVATEIKTSPIKSARDFAADKKGICVLKDAVTVVSDGHYTYVNSYGNCGMATAGSGDALTGIIAALLGEGMERFKAAYLGVLIHSLAGDVARDNLGERSVLASDITKAIPFALKKIDQPKC